MTAEFARLVEEALAADDPFAALPQLVLDQRARGVPAAELIEALSARLGPEEDDDTVRDVLDLLTGWCAPHLRID